MTSQIITVGSLTTTGLDTAYTALSKVLACGLASKIRFYASSVRALGSGATTTTIKLQMRFNDGSTTTAYVDLPSQLDDVQGAAQPKGSTLEIEHAFSTAANATTVNTFRLDDARGLCDVTVNVKVNAAGGVGDSTTVYAVLAG